MITTPGVDLDRAGAAADEAFRGPASRSWWTIAAPLVGSVTSYDIQSEKPIRYMQSLDRLAHDRRLARRDGREHHGGR